MLEETFTKCNEILSTELKWFHFHQNNSGGYFVRDENVDEDVYIQALNAEEAIEKAESFMDNSDSCPCCGDRWHFWVEDSDGTSEPLKYGEPIANKPQFEMASRYILHFADGRIEKVSGPSKDCLA